MVNCEESLCECGAVVLNWSVGECVCVCEYGILSERSEVKNLVF